ncbi:uncharacterized protein LOC120343265 [Styela clava]
MPVSTSMNWYTVVNTTEVYVSNVTATDGNTIWKTDQLYRNWLTLVAVTGCGFILNLYIVIAMIIHLSRMKNLSKSLKKKGPKRYRILMEISLLITACMVLFNTPATEKIIVELYVPSLCPVMRRIRGTAGSFVFLFSYLTLWFRQRSIYNDPAMRHLTTKTTRTLSIVVVFLLTLSPLTTFLIYVSAYTFAVVDSGCAIVSSTVNPQAMWIVIGSTSLLMQFMLLWLFVIPLYKHKSNLTQGGNLGNRLKIKSITRRAFITGLACSITDTLSVAMAASSVLRDGVTLPLSMYITLLVNLLMVLLSFPDWKKKMLPCCIHIWITKPPEEESSQGRISSKETEA